jgi:hypothetical protein
MELTSSAVAEAAAVAAPVAEDAAAAAVAAAAALVLITSEDSCLRVWVRFLLASARALVSRRGRKHEDAVGAAAGAAVAVAAGADGAVDEEAEAAAAAEAVLAARLALAAAVLTVDNCSWMSIMWSPRRIVRFSGALPERKSTTCGGEERASEEGVCAEMEMDRMVIRPNSFHLFLSRTRET